MREGLSAGIGADLMRDENHFLDTLHIVTAESHAVVEPPEGQGTLVKRMSVLKRADGTRAEDFPREWSEGYAALVRAMPGVRGYRQNLIVVRERVNGTPCAYEELPIDGIGELWFDDAQSMERAFSSTPGHEAMAYAKTFLAEITSFLVRVYRVI